MSTRQTSLPTGRHAYGAINSPTWRPRGTRGRRGRPSGDWRAAVTGWETRPPGRAPMLHSAWQVVLATPDPSCDLVRRITCPQLTVPSERDSSRRGTRRGAGGPWSRDGASASASARSGSPAARRRAYKDSLNPLNPKKKVLEIQAERRPGCVVGQLSGLVPPLHWHWASWALLCVHSHLLRYCSDQNPWPCAARKRARAEHAARAPAQLSAVCTAPRTLLPPPLRCTRGYSEHIFQALRRAPHHGWGGTEAFGRT